MKQTLSKNSSQYCFSNCSSTNNNKKKIAFTNVAKPIGIESNYDFVFKNSQGDLKF